MTHERLKALAEMYGRDDAPTVQAGEQSRWLIQEFARGYIEIVGKLEELRDAVRAHRDARGDDRCWMDDEELYKALPEGFVPPKRDTAVELSNCLKFVASRQNPATEYTSPEREIERLRAELDSRGEIVKACPVCMAALDRIFRRYESDDWICGMCKETFDDLAYYQRVNAPSAVGAK